MAQKKYFVLFDTDKDLVPDTAMAFLIKTIYTNDVKKISLEGHCDSIGSRKYNYNLSKRRVKAVEQLLIENGFDKKKIDGSVGYGKDKPIAANSSEKNRQKNRRVLVLFELNKETNPKTKLLVKKEALPKRQSTLKISKKRIIKKQTTPAERPKELKAENFKPNTLIALPNLIFQGGRHFLLPRSTASLDTLVRILKEKTDVRIEIQGHVCCTTYHIDGYDWDTRTDNLSVNRARAIRHFLIRQGIAPDRLLTRGFGGTRKLYPLEENSFQIENNRRVEVFVLP